MIRIGWRLLAAACAGALFLQSAAAQELSRGINAATWFTWPRYVAFDKPGLRNPVFPPAREMPRGEDFRQLSGMGFTSLRLAVDPALYHVLKGKAAEAVEARLDAAIKDAVAAGLTVIVDLHPNSKHKIYGQDALRPTGSATAQDEYVAAVERAAARLAHFERGKVVLELMNEPRGKCSGAATEDWGTMLGRMIAAASKAAPDLPLVVSGACTSSIEGLLALEPSRWQRPGLYYTFHFYEPFGFTHQGADFIGWPERYLASVPWPTGAGINAPALLRDATSRMKSLRTAERVKMTVGVQQALAKLAAAPVNAAEIRQRFAAVARWADMHHIPRASILLGEFGVYARVGGKPGADCADQARWVKAVREAAEREGFSWSFFHRDGAFGVLDAETRQPKPALLHALGLRDDGACPPVG